MGSIVQPSCPLFSWEYSHGPAPLIAQRVLAASSPVRRPTFESILRKVNPFTQKAMLSLPTPQGFFPHNDLIFFIWASPGMAPALLNISPTYLTAWPRLEKVQFVIS